MITFLKRAAARVLTFLKGSVEELAALSGAACVSVAAGMVAVPLGLFVCGMFLLGAAVLSARSAD